MHPSRLHVKYILFPTALPLLPVTLCLRRCASYLEFIAQRRCPRLGQGVLLPATEQGVCASVCRMSKRTVWKWSPGSWLLALCLAWLWTRLALASLQPTTTTGLGEVERPRETWRARHLAHPVSKQAHLRDTDSRLSGCPWVPLPGLSASLCCPGLDKACESREGLTAYTSFRAGRCPVGREMLG